MASEASTSDPVAATASGATGVETLGDHVVTEATAAEGGEVEYADGAANEAPAGTDRDVNSILANLNEEQLASIVAAARASGGEGDEYGGGGDATNLLATLPPGLGQAASALTSFASSIRREGGENGEEGADGVEQGHHQHDEEEVDKKPQLGEHADESQYTHGGDMTEEIDDSLAQTTEAPGDDTRDDYRNEHDTQAAIAAMESLAAASHLDQDAMGKNAGRLKRDTGPEAERLRKDQHKEVERKRREQISNGITDLANIVPGCDTKGINKTAIINAAVRYIVELKNNEASNIEKWTLEKLLMDQAMGDLTAQLEAMRKEVSHLRAELGLPDEPIEVEQHHYDVNGAEGGEEEGMEEQQQHEGALEEQHAHEEHQEEVGEAVQEGQEGAIDPSLGHDGDAKAGDESRTGHYEESMEQELAQDGKGTLNVHTGEEAEEAQTRRRGHEQIDVTVNEDGAPTKRSRNV